MVSPPNDKPTLPKDPEPALDGGALEDGADPAASQAAGAGVPAGGLQQRAAKGTLWVIGSFGATQVLRLLSNLVLSRVLFPEAFGLMRIVQLISMGISMVTDTGLRGSVIYHPRGEEKNFLNTAFSLQFLRGLLISVALLIAAWPAAAFYEAPQLRGLLALVAAGVLFSGLSSTSVLTLARRVNPKPAAILEGVAKAISIVVMIALALVWKSVWVLAIGLVLGGVLLAAGSHFLIPGYRNRFHWDKDAARSMLRYGKWVFLSSALGAVLSQGDSAVLGKLLDERWLGVYSFALILASTATQGMNAISTRVLQPVYAQFAREDPSLLRRRLFKVRGACLGAALPVLWIMSIFGQEIVNILFDERYAEAGWMLRILAAGAIATITINTAERILSAVGDSFSHLILNVSSALFFLAGMVVGYHFGELVGLLIGMSVGRALAYIPLAVLLRRKGAWLPTLDFGALGLSALVIGAGFYLYPPSFGL